MQFLALRLSIMHVIAAHHLCAQLEKSTKHTKAKMKKHEEYPTLLFKNSSVIETTILTTTINLQKKAEISVVAIAILSIHLKADLKPQTFSKSNLLRETHHPSYFVIRDVSPWSVGQQHLSLAMYYNPTELQAGSYTI